MSTPGTAGGPVAEAAGGLSRVWRPRVQLEAGAQAAWAGGGLGLSHPRLSTEDDQESPLRRGLRDTKNIRVRGSRGGHAPTLCPPAAPRLTRQHKPPHQHHVPWVLAHVCWRLQGLQHGWRSRLLKQQPQGRQLPGGHDGEVDSSLHKRGQAVRMKPQGQVPARLWDRRPKT